MAYYGISTNLVVYLTKKLHQGTVESSNNISNWGGSVWLMPLAGAYVADAYLGRYWTFIIASCIYLMVCYVIFTSSFEYILFIDIERYIELDKLNEHYVLNVIFILLVSNKCCDLCYLM
jgi:dipeptide/tripeptide permease